MNKNKEPSLLRKIIDIHYEQAKRRKALRHLAKTEWSIEFLTEIIRQAAKSYDKDVQLEIETPGGHKIRISSANKRFTNNSIDDDIFNKLDDDTAIERFIIEHQPKR